LGPLEPNGPGESGVSQEKNKVIQVIVSNLETFKRILERESNDGHENFIDTVFGQRVPIIGSWRLKTMEIVQKLILLEDQDIYDKINDLDILKIISVRINSYKITCKLRIKA